ncbi:MAG: hypothetical protein MUF69_14420, partial [Desulfobacterota bacterium]|nr:hypothetical protein [Thermodesulfobacteriota bacterium]
FSLNFALLPVLMTILGGLGTLSGPIVGAVVLSGLFELANIWLPEIHPIISGLFIILVMLFLPQGLVQWTHPASGATNPSGVPFRACWSFLGKVRGRR